MPMPATGLLQLYLWQGRMRVENLPVYIRRQMSVYIRRQMSHPMKVLAAGASAELAGHLFSFGSWPDVPYSSRSRRGSLGTSSGQTRSTTARWSFDMVAITSFSSMNW